jgi:hypothetical protein
VVFNYRYSLLACGVMQLRSECLPPGHQGDGASCDTKSMLHRRTLLSAKYQTDLNCIALFISDVRVTRSTPKNLKKFPIDRVRSSHQL